MGEGRNSWKHLNSRNYDSSEEWNLLHQIKEICPVDTRDKANTGLKEQSKIFAKNSYLENTKWNKQNILINNSQKWKKITNKLLKMYSKLPVMSDINIQITMK